MPRGFGEVEALQALPDAVVALFALVTQLGDAWFVFGVLAVLYWFGGHLPGLEGTIDRRRGAFLVALVLGGLGLSTGLKSLFALPRPPGAGVARGADLFPAVVRPVYENFATADGYGFPSGHAVRATLAWGGLALALDVGTRRQRYAVVAAAGVVVALVALSRVVIGAHYAVDVVAGVGVGVAYLAVVWRLGGPDAPTRAFSLALAVALGAVLVGGFERDPLGVLGAALGARVTWGAVGGALLDSVPTRRAGALAAAVGLPVFGGLFVAVYALELSPTAAFVATGVALAGVLALPLGIERG